jgi:magnesium-transporting ATPase (P-type)
VHPVDFDTLLRESDAISIHVHMTPENRPLFDAQTFARMKSGAVLINTSRGDVVDETTPVEVDPARRDGYTAAKLAQEVEARRARHGPNRLAEAASVGALQRFLRQFDNLLLYVLIGAAVITAALGHWVDSAVIAAVVLLNAVIGFVQEGKAEKAMQAIRHLLAPRALVLRDGRQHGIDAAELVPGDVVLLASGDSVPADVRLLQVHNLRVDESALTGESAGFTGSARKLNATGSDLSWGGWRGFFRPWSRFST